MSELINWTALSRSGSVSVDVIEREVAGMEKENAELRAEVKRLKYRAPGSKRLRYDKDKKAIVEEPSSALEHIRAERDKLLEDRDRWKDNANIAQANHMACEAGRETLEQEYIAVKAKVQRLTVLGEAAQKVRDRRDQNAADLGVERPRTEVDEALAECERHGDLKTRKGGAT